MIDGLSEDKMSNLRKKLIRLAYQKPELRSEILPLLKTAADLVFVSGYRPMSIEDALKERDHLYRRLKARANGLVLQSGRKKTRALLRQSWSDVQMTNEGVKFEAIQASLGRKGIPMLRHEP